MVCFLGLVLRLLHKRKHFEVLAKIRTGNWWFYTLLGLSEAMSIYLEQQLGQAFLLFPRNVKTFFENSFLTREKKEAALPASLLTLCAPGPTPTHRHTTKLGTGSELLAGSVHTQTPPASPSPCHAPAMARCPAGSSRELLWTSAWGKMTTQTFPNTPTLMALLHTGLLPAISHSLHRAVKIHTANFIHKLFFWVNKSQRGKTSKI